MIIINIVKVQYRLRMHVFCVYVCVCVCVYTFDHTVYGALCGTSAVLISMVIVMVCVGVYIRCKHKGTVMVLVLYSK